MQTVSTQEEESHLAVKSGSKQERKTRRVIHLKRAEIETARPFLESIAKLTTSRGCGPNSAKAINSLLTEADGKDLLTLLKILHRIAVGTTPLPSLLERRLQVDNLWLRAVKQLADKPTVLAVLKSGRWEKRLGVSQLLKEIDCLLPEIIGGVLLQDSTNLSDSVGTTHHVQHHHKEPPKIATSPRVSAKDLEDVPSKHQSDKQELLPGGDHQREADIHHKKEEDSENHE